MFCPLAAFLFVLFDRHHWITVSWLFDLIDLLLLWGALFYDFRNLLIIAMIHFTRQTVFVYEPLFFFFLHNWLRSISFSSLEHVFVCVYVCFAHTHTRTLSPLRKLFSPALIGGLTATEGGETLGLISIPVQSDKCAGKLTWCFGERHTQKGRGGPSCVVYGASESHRGSKAQPSSLTSPRTRSGSAVCALRRTAQTENFTLSLEDRTTPSSFLRLSLLDCLEAFRRPLLTLTPGSAELWPVPPRAPGHPWGWRPQPGWICSGSCGERGSWSLWCSFRCPCFPYRSSTLPVWVRERECEKMWSFYHYTQHIHATERLP